MSQFIDNSIFYGISACLFQGLASLAIAASVLPLVSHLRQISYFRLLFGLLVCNLFLLGWGCVGSSAWDYFTEDKLTLADNSVLWFPWVPFGYPAPFGTYSWEILPGSSDFKLRLIWAALALPVWFLTGLFTFVTMRYGIPLARRFYHRYDAKVAASETN